MTKIRSEKHLCEILSHDQYIWKVLNLQWRKWQHTTIAELRYFFLSILAF